jgi:hypothetical protein
MSGYYHIGARFGRYFINGEMTVSQAVEHFRPEFQNMIDEAFQLTGAH